jgi:DMSO reductase anchor subunit
MAWKALRNLRRSWLSREVLLFGVFAPVAVAAVAAPALAPVAAAVGTAGVVASARLYIVPGRPSWDSWLTFAAFGATGLAVGAPLTGHVALGAAGVALGLGVLAANLVRLHASPVDVSRRGTVGLYLHRLRSWTALRVALAAAALVAVAGGSPLAAAALGLGGEVVGRWLFYVTVVPANMPGSFWRHTAGSHR